MMPFIILAGCMAAAGVVAWIFWGKIQSWFRDSETLFWGRLQMASGVIVAAAAGMDWSALLAGTGRPFREMLGLAGFLFVQGLVTELARRSRATDL
jgi:hypothetical protein